MTVSSIPLTGNVTISGGTGSFEHELSQLSPGTYEVEVRSPLGPHGTSHVITIDPILRTGNTINMVGAGGGGGNGFFNRGDYAGVFGGAGGASQVVYQGNILVSAAGGAGGEAGGIGRADSRNRGGPGGDTVNFGLGGDWTSSDNVHGNDARGNGGGGGGGAGDGPDTYDHSGAGGEGGEAGTEVIGFTFDAYTGNTLYITVGEGGTGRQVEWSGGDGGDGQVDITVNGATTTFNTAGLHELVVT